MTSKVFSNLISSVIPDHLDIISLTSLGESGENMFLQKRGEYFPLETESLMKAEDRRWEAVTAQADRKSVV